MNANRLGRRRGLPVVAVFGLLVTAPGGTMTATDIDPPNVLDRAIVDVAVVPPPDVGGGSGPDRLLTVGLHTDPDVAHRLALLERTDEGWLETSSLLVEGGTDPWLIDLDGAIFALLSQTDRTAVDVAIVRVEDRGLTLAGTRGVPFAATGAAAADVDGDGTSELVVGGRAGRRGRLGVCVGTRLLVLDPDDLARERTIDLREIDLESAVVGEFDGEPGDDIAGLTICGPPRLMLDGARVVAARLSDGRLIADVRPGPELVGVPLAIDLDGDERDEVVVSDGSEVAVVHGATGSDMQSGITRLSDGPPGIAVAALAGSKRWSAALARFGSAGLAVVAPDRGADGTTSLVSRTYASLTVDDPRWRRSLEVIDAGARGSEPAVAFWHDLDADGCPDLLVPLFIVMCSDAPTPDVVATFEPDQPGWSPPAWAGTARPGPEWVSSRPIGVVGVGSAQRLLVAQAIDAADLVALNVPLPLPAWTGNGVGGWRARASGPFALAELTLDELVPRHAVQASGTRVESGPPQRPGIAIISGPSGSRLLVEVVAVADGDADPGSRPNLSRFLEVAQGRLGSEVPGRADHVVRLDVRRGSAAASGRATVTIPLEEVRAGDGLVAHRWAVTVVAIDPWGDIQDPVRVMVGPDTRGPTLRVDVPGLRVDAPPLIAVWPFTTRLSGVAEPGATIRANDLPPVVAEADGSFSVEIALAPWPQDVEIVATDEAGNTTSRRLSIVGGFDYRRLPWQVVLPGLILLAVLAGTLREIRRGRAPLVVATGSASGAPGQDPAGPPKTEAFDGRPRGGRDDARDTAEIVDIASGRITATAPPAGGLASGDPRDADDGGATPGPSG